MQQFSIEKEKLKEIQKQNLKRSIPILIIAGIAGIAISFINGQSKDTDPWSLIIMIPLLTVALGFGISRGAKRQNALLESYRLTIINNLIKRDQLNTPAISLYFNDVTEIIKNINGSFTIKGKSSKDVIHIPTQIEHYNELEEILATIKPITIQTAEPFQQKYKVLLLLVIIASMFTVFVATNRILVAIAGCIFVAIAVWSLYEIRTNKSIDAKTKKASLWMIVVLVSVIGAMIMKLALPGVYYNN